MSNAQYASYDRGFDLGHAEVPSVRSPTIERTFVSSVPRKAPWKKYTAMFLVGLMVISGIAMLVPSSSKPTATVPDDNVQKDQPSLQIGGSPSINWTISNLFETYKKPTDYAQLGRHNTTMGWNQWWDARVGYYDDTKVRDSYPYTTMYSYYSANIPTNIKDNRMAFGVYSFYRMTIDAKNIDAVSTGAGKDMNFIPILNPSGLAMSGGWVNWTWYLTYLTAQEETDIMAGTHYANTYYNVPIGGVTWGGSQYNDGWWLELQGKMDFNRAAASKFLNLNGAGSLITQFNTANVGNAVGNAFVTHWTNEGSRTGTINIYCTYDYELSAGFPCLFLSVDPLATADKLILRMWGTAWGYETLIERFLELAGVAKYQQVYPEDMYLNGTASPTNGDISVREVCVYKILAWKDTGTWAPAWNLDTVHSDACRNTAVSGAGPPVSWPSRYQFYGATNVPAYHPNVTEWGPGTVNWGTRVMYWQPPMGFNLTLGQQLSVKLGNVASMGYEPYRGATDVYEDSAAKIAELGSHQVWGELVLGHGYPLTGVNRLNQTAFYNHATKTLTLKGPLDLNTKPNTNPYNGRLNETGCPDIMFAVSRVSNYNVQISGASPPYVAGQTYNLIVTASNFTGVPISNGTVVLASNNPGTTFGGGPSHTFVPSENGVWTTTVVFGGQKSNTYINATSSMFPLDVNGAGGAWQVNAAIPEFSMMLMPVFMVAIAVVIMVGRRRKDESE